MRTFTFRAGIAALMLAMSVGTSGRSIAAGGLVQNRAPQQRAARAHSLIEGFDECLQQRFKDVDEGFGFTRIIKAGTTPHRFKPENAREEESVRDLEREGLRVVLYLAGRRVMSSVDRTINNDAAVVALNATAGSLVKGPVVVTTVKPEDDLPPIPALDLRDESRRAMMTFDRGSSYSFTTGKWTFIARAVRASEPSCVHCHMADGTAYTSPVRDPASTLRVGDPLGALLYAYQFVR